MRVPLGSYVPDLSPLVAQKGVLKALNATPTSGGWASVPSLVPVSGADAIDNYARGAISGIDLSGDAFNFVGDESKLYRVIETGATDLSRAAGYSAASLTRWEFAVFGETIFATNFNDPMQYYDLRGSSLFDDVANLANAPAVPRAKHIAVIDNFLVAGNIYDPVSGPIGNGISWSAVNAALAWPTRGEDLAVSLQSDQQQLEGNGGPVNAVIAGSEVGAVFQKDAIWRMDYVGGDVVFHLRRVEPDHGLLAPGFAVALGRNVFFLSEDGFRMFNYTASQPVGKDRVDSTFFADLKQEYIDRVSISKHPDKTLVYILYPGSGADSEGTPNKLLIYDYVLNEFGHGDLDAEVLVNSVTPTASLDAPATTGDPDDLVSDTDSFDDRLAPAGSRTIGAYNSSHILSGFSGPPPDAVFESGHLELVPGSRAFMKEVRPLVDGAEVTVQVAATSTRKQDMVFGREIAQTDDGNCPIRRDGRYHQIRLNAKGSFTNAVGFDVSANRSGGR